MTGAAMLHLLDAEVEESWVDYNGHMNDACYAILMSQATDALMQRIGLGPEGRKAAKLTIYTLSMLIHYLKEAKLGAPLSLHGQMLEHDDRRIRFWIELRHGAGGDVLALSEQLLICIDQSGAAPRPAPFAPAMQEKIAAIALEHAKLPAPERAGQGISLRRRPRG